MTKDPTPAAGRITLERLEEIRDRVGKYACAYASGDCFAVELLGHIAAITPPVVRGQPIVVGTPPIACEAATGTVALSIDSSAHELFAECQRLTARVAELEGDLAETERLRQLNYHNATHMADMAVKTEAARAVTESRAQEAERRLESARADALEELRATLVPKWRKQSAWWAAALDEQITKLKAALSTPGEQKCG